MARYYLVQYDGTPGAWNPPAGFDAHHAAIEAVGSSGCMTRREWDEALGVAMIETCDCCRIDAPWAMQVLNPEVGVKAWEVARLETLDGREVMRG